MKNRYKLAKNENRTFLFISLFKYAFDGQDYSPKDQEIKSQLITQTSAQVIKLQILHSYDLYSSK